MASITAVLSDYAPETVRLVTDPRTGIATQEKFRIWMPNPGELKAACDDIEAPARRARERAKAMDNYWRENVALESEPCPRLTFEEMKAKYGETWGIGSTTAEQAPRSNFKRYSDDDLRAIYGGENPRYVPMPGTIK